MSTGSVLGVVGLGLIGGSVALDALDAGTDLVATDVDPVQVEAARAAGVEVVDDAAEVARRASLVVVATPAPQVAQVLRALDEATTTPLVATSVASVQSPHVLGIEVGRFARVRHVGGHPMTGTERSGFRAARRGMFDGSPWIVTPSVGDDAAILRVVVTHAASTGAQPVVLPPDEHDRVVALLSHLPHVLAYTTYAQLAARDAHGTEPLAGGSFRDLTRVAATRPSFWAEVLHLNAAAVADLIADLREGLGQVEQLLRDGASTEQLEEVLTTGHRSVGRPRPEVPSPTTVPDGPLTRSTLDELWGHTRAGLAIESWDAATGAVSWTPL